MRAEAAPMALCPHDGKSVFQQQVRSLIAPEMNDAVIDDVIRAEQALSDIATAIDRMVYQLDEFSECLRQVFAGRQNRSAALRPSHPPESPMGGRTAFVYEHYMTSPALVPPPWRASSSDAVRLGRTSVGGPSSEPRRSAAAG